MNPEQFEDELVSLMAMIQSQQEELTQQHQVVKTAALALGEERKKIAAVLLELRDIPEQAIGTLETAVAAAVRGSLADSITEERKTLYGAVNVATQRLKKVQDKGAVHALVWGAIGAVLGGVLVGGGMWWAVTSGAIQQSVIVNNPQGFADALRPYLQQAPARHR